MTACTVGNMLGTSFWSVHGILKYNMNYVWIGAKCVFCLLFCVCESLAREKMTVIPHPPYWQGSVLCEFFLSKHVKVSYKGRRFSMIQAKLQNVLATFQTMHLSKCFEQRYDHWTCCINSKETIQRAALIRSVRAVCYGEINPVQRQITPHTVSLYQWYMFLNGALW